jgi:hypothetical protein
MKRNHKLKLYTHGILTQIADFKENDIQAFMTVEMLNNSFKAANVLDENNFYFLEWKGMNEIKYSFSHATIEIMPIKLEAKLRSQLWKLQS